MEEKKTEEDEDVVVVVLPPHLHPSCLAENRSASSTRVKRKREREQEDRREKGKKEQEKDGRRWTGCGRCSSSTSESIVLSRRQHREDHSAAGA